MKVKSNKKGFTLLEVMLATAILLIASTMVMQGFLSTMTYSYNSAVYAKDGAKNNAKVTKDLADVAVAKDVSGPSGGENLVLKFGTEESSKTAKFSVLSWSSTDHSGQDIKAAYAENGSSVSNRYALTYTLPAAYKCPKCKSSAKLARDSADEANNYRWFCKACNVYCEDGSSTETEESKSES